MESITIKSADGPSSITLLDREPYDRNSLLDYFTVRIVDSHLDAAARVYAYMCTGLPELFANVARNWQDFKGPQAWSSLEREFKVEVLGDGIGHFTILAELRSGPYERDWTVRSSVMIETSQLDRVAEDIAEFLGSHS